MAIAIYGLTRLQEELLKDAFGYESYPNGNHGHSILTVEWLLKSFEPVEIRYGCPELPGGMTFEKVYFTPRQIKELKSMPKRKWQRG